MGKLSKKASQFLNSLDSIPKAQEGISFPYIDDTNYILDPNNISGSIQEAKEKQTVRLKDDYGSIQPMFNSNPNVQKLDSYDTQDALGMDAGSGIPVLANLFKMAKGLSYGPRKVKRDRDIANSFEKESERDFKLRSNESKANSFYMTPYTVGRSDDLTMKDGGIILFQDGGLFDFQNYFNSMEENRKTSIDKLQDYYKKESNRLDKLWREKTVSSGTNTAAGAIGAITDIVGIFGGGGGNTQVETPESQQQISFKEGGRKAIFNRVLNRLQQGGLTETVDTFLFGNNVPKYSPEKQTSSDHVNADIQRAKEYDRNPNQYKSLNTIVNGGDPEDIKLRGSKKVRFREQQEGGEIENIYDPNYNPYPEQENKTNQILEYLMAESEINLEESETDVMLNSLVNQSFRNNSQNITPSTQDTYSTQNVPIATNLKVSGDISSMNNKSIAISHNNVGNIKYGSFAQKYGAVPGRRATDGGVFAKFPSVEAGMKAQEDLLRSGSYANLTVAEAMKKWSNSGYASDLVPQLSGKKMKDLTHEEFEMLRQAQIKREDPRMYQILYGS